MYLAGIPLRTFAELQKAIIRSIPVNVWQNGNLIDQGGLIESQTKDVVIIDGGYFLKATCEFRTR